MLDDRQKKILFAVFFIAASILFGYILYRMFFPNVNVSTPMAEEERNGQLPVAGNGGPTSTDGTKPQNGVLQPSIPSVRPQPTSSHTRILNDAETRNVSPTPDGQGVRYYNPDDGRFYRVRADGTIETMSDRQFFNVAAVSWGNKTDKNILTFEDGKHGYYNFETNAYVPLPDYWQNFRFSPDDARVAEKSIGVDPDNRYLITTNPDGTEIKPINAMGENSDLVHVNWVPHGQIIAWTETGEPQSDGQQILMVGQHKENFKGLIAPGNDFLPNWSPGGKTVLFSVWSDATQNQPSIWVTSGEAGSIGAGRKNLHINTWADKCAWGSESVVFCAVPQNLPENAGIDRSSAKDLPDDIYKIDLSGGQITKISTPSQTRPVANPVISKDLKTFTFTDTANGKLYQYDLL